MGIAGIAVGGVAGGLKGASDFYDTFADVATKRVDEARGYIEDERVYQRGLSDAKVVLLEKRGHEAGLLKEAQKHEANLLSKKNIREDLLSEETRINSIEDYETKKKLDKKYADKKLDPLLELQWKSYDKQILELLDFDEYDSPESIEKRINQATAIRVKQVALFPDNKKNTGKEDPDIEDPYGLLKLGDGGNKEEVEEEVETIYHPQDQKIEAGALEQAKNLTTKIWDWVSELGIDFSKHGKDFDDEVMKVKNGELSILDAATNIARFANATASKIQEALSNMMKDPKGMQEWLAEVRASSPKA